MNRGWGWGGGGGSEGKAECSVLRAREEGGGERGEAQSNDQRRWKDQKA